MPKFLETILSPFRVLGLQVWLVILALLLVLVVMSTCSIRGMFDRGKVSRGEVVQDQNAREGAAASRIEDKGRQDKMEDALNEAVADLPDNVPSHRRLALACQRLRNDGHSELPSYCGPDPDRKAPPRPG